MTSNAKPHRHATLPAQPPLAAPQTLADPAEAVGGGRSALVFGASGFIGRWLVRELLSQDVTTTAVVRSDSSADQLLRWLREHHAPSLPELIRADFDRDDFGWPPGDAPVATEVYNMAGAYAFGMTTAQARAANVDTARRVVTFAATLPGLVRLVHLSGYRVGGQDPATVPWTAQRINAQYRRLGAYEASKVESDAVVQAHAANLGVPFSIVNPSTVIGDSRTGESPQTLGLGATVLDLLAGRMPALPGGPSTFVPVVTVDYLATFAALLATRADTEGQSYWVLDDNTPPLPDLLRLVAADHGVTVPRLHVPVAVLKRLPSKITRADPETLSFLASDRYPTGPADALAREHGLKHPDVAESLRRWSRYLARQGPHHTKQVEPSGRNARARQTLNTGAP
jgi:nucleoside-diphosphate-sugar epimerase